MMTELEKYEAIVKYVAAHPEPIEAYTPRAIQISKCKEGQKYWDATTGDVYRTGDKTIDWEAIEKDFHTDNRIVYIKPSGKYNCFMGYIKYIPGTNKDDDMVEISTIKMKNNTGKPGETRKWEYTDCGVHRHFIFHNDLHDYGPDGFQRTKHVCGRYNRIIADKLKQIGDYGSPSITGSEFAKFADTSNEFYSGWAMREWYQENCLLGGLKMKPELQTVVEINLKPIEEISKEYPIETVEVMRDVYDYRTDSYIPEPYKEIKTVGGVYFEEVNDDYCVLRCLQRSETWNRMEKRYEYTNDFNERYRIYIDKKGKSTIMDKRWGNWDLSNKQIKSIIPYTAQPLLNIDELDKWERLKWIKGIIEETGGTEGNKNDKGINPALMIVNIMRHPMVETIYKAGYHNITKVILNNNYIARNIERIFGVKEKKRGKLTTILQCNKDVLNWLETNLPREGKDKVEKHGGTWYSFDDHASLTVRFAKQIIGDLQYISKDSIKNDFPVLKKIIEMTNGSPERFVRPETRYWYRADSFDVVLTEDEIKKLQHFINVGKRPDGETVLEIIRDTIYSWAGMRHDERPNIDCIYTMKTLREAQELHDNVTNLANDMAEMHRAGWDSSVREKYEKLERKMRALQKQRKEMFEYTDGKYAIVVPEQLLDIANEGITLKHCVGGYREQHANGETTILFLRKVDSLDTSFYTVEVTNEHKIKEIRGFSNKWLGHDSDKNLIQFVINWLKMKGIECDKENLLGTGIGFVPGDLLDDTGLVW